MEDTDRVLRNLKRVNYKNLADGELEVDLWSDTGEVFHKSPVKEATKELDEGIDDIEQLEKLVKEQEDRRERLLKDQKRKELQEKLNSLKENNDLLQVGASAPKDNVVRRTALKSSKSKHEESLETLRDDDNLARKVDKMMARLNILSEEPESDESSSSDTSVASSDDESDDNMDMRRARRKDSSRRKAKRSTKKKGMKSGKDRKPTSKVINPQKWPHSELNTTFIDSNILFEKLSIDAFVAGYATILQGCKPSSREYRARLEHLISLMYLASCYEWKAVLSFHGAVLLEIERGRAKWGQSFNYLEARTLHGHLKVEKSSEHKASSNSVLFCKDFQKGKCKQTRDHKGLFKGESCYLKHICAACWISKRTQQPHAENTQECPLTHAHSKA